MGHPVASSKPIDSLLTPSLPRSPDRPGASGSWFKRHDGRSVGAELCCLPTRIHLAGVTEPHQNATT